jgi:hypothetical protein
MGVSETCGILQCVTVAVLTCTVVAGCKSPEPEPPRTYPATGRVVFKGGKPFAGGVITFTSKADPTRTMEASLSEGGTFELSMMFKNRRLAGAVEGPYEVMVSSRFSPKRGVEIYLLPGTYHVEARENSFQIEVDPSTARR